MMKMPIHIHGSVDDAPPILLGFEEELYLPPDFKEYMRNERLNWSRIDGISFLGDPTLGWVFWSQLDNNSADLIRQALQKLKGLFKEELNCSLVQFWAATKTSEGRTLLTTQFQPFALGITCNKDFRNRLCSYRMGMCREYNNSFYADAECAQEHLGLPGRVFLNQLPESTPDVALYTLKEYPQRDLALRCEIGFTWAEPVFNHSSHACVGVLEIVSTVFISFLRPKSFLSQMCDIFQEVGLQCFDVYKHYELQIGDENIAFTTAFQELKTVLETVCKIHKLPLAMTWVPCSACNDLRRGQLLSEGVEFIRPRNNCRAENFIKVSKCSHLRKEVVAGMVVSSHNMLYCSDITKLSLVEYPFAPHARYCKFRGWLTICLQSSYTANYIYVLEFFLPRSYKDRDNSKKKNRSGKNRYCDNSWTSLSLILGTMEKNFRTFKLASGLELGDLLSVEVIDFFKGQKLHSVQKIQAKGGGEMLQIRQLDQASTGAIHSGMNVVSEDQNIPRLEAVQNGEVTMQLDSSHQPPLDPPNNGQHVVIAERNISTVTSLEERKRKTQRADKGTGVRIEVSLEDILKCGKMSRAEAAEKLQVSVSTLKPIHIHGSVDDAPPILLGVEEEEHFTSDFKEYIRKEQLNWSRFEGKHPDWDVRPSFGWVFWSQLDNSADLIRHALQKLIGVLKNELRCCLVQFWAATKTSEGRTLLTTQFQPFALGETLYASGVRKLLCEYRMGMCREYNNSFYADAECAEEQLGLPGRVFLNKLPEFTPHVKYYTLKEYPQRDLALRCEIGSSVAVPVFDHSSHTCVGVLEIVTLYCAREDWHDKSIIGQMYDIFQEFGLLCFDGCKHYEMQIRDENKARTTAFQELKTVLERVCKFHELPLAMTWVPCSACNGFVHGQLLSEGVEFCGLQKHWLDLFGKVIKCSHLGKGGVAGMVLSSPNMLYCSDIAQLSLAEYPLVHYARLLEFRGCFTLYVQSSYTANDIYVLEFFLPTSNRWGVNSQTSLSLILGTMEENFRTFKLVSGQEPGDLLSVEVMDFQNGLKLHSVEKIQAKGRGVMLQPGHLDQPPMDAISNETNVVSEAHTILLGVEELNYFLPDFKEYIQKERLYWSRIERYLGFGWVFWSQLDNSADLIRHALQKLISKDELYCSLVQFWAATKTSEGRTLLTTQFQPFALGSAFYTPQRNGLCSYRMGMCREYNNSFNADAECAQELLGLPGRVFLNKLPESTPDVKHYTLKEYPQRDLALRCGIESSCAVPVFLHSSHTCVGVLEIVSLYNMVQDWHDKSFLGQMYDIFQEVGLQCFDGYKHSELQIGDENKAGAFQELKTVLETVCKIHKLPLAMTWVTCSACKSLLRGKLLSEGVEIFQRRTSNQNRFIQVSKCSHLTTGVVAGMVHSSSNILYCSDITQLSLAEYPLVPYARLCEFRGWFTICLQSNYTANDIYVLEFFLPSSSNKSWTSLSLILRTMEKNFRTFKLASGQELGELLSVEVMDFRTGRKLHSREKIQAKGGGVRLQLRQLDQASKGAIHSGMNVISEDQNIPRLEAVQNGEVTMQLDSSHQPALDPPNNGQHVVIAERNISTVTSLEERKRKMQRVDKGTGVRIEVPSEDILKCAKMSRADAAEKLQVSVSTLKRVCRGYGIDRWPPRNIEKFRSFRPSPVENEGQTRQRLNSDLPSNQGLDCVAHTKPAFQDLPSNQASDSVAHTKPAFQDVDIVTIKAKCENNTIKFQLSLPSRLVALQQEAAKRLKLEAGTYYIRYEDEENDSILIACDEDLQGCIDTFKSLGKTSVVVQLEPK